MSSRCRICNTPAALYFQATDRNRRISKDHFDYYRCTTCELVFLSPVPDNIDHYYPTNYYSIPLSERQLASAANLERYKIDIVQRFSPRGRLLEIGPSYGSFAYLAKHAGYETEVIEMSLECCKFLRDVVGIRTVQSDDPDNALQGLSPFDVITLWHVIEHLAEPWDLLNTISRKLRSGGILVIAAPNPSAMQFRILGRLWPHVDAPRHVALIPEQLLTSRMQSLGLRRIWATTNDEGSKGWNVFGWEFFFANMTANRYFKFALRIFGKFFAILMGPFERTEGKGSAYTIVFRKEP